MQKIVISQAYQEEMLIGRWLSYIYPLVDKIIISEGRLTPFGNLPNHSTDKTREIIKQWVNKDTKSKIIFTDSFEGNPNNREKAEGNNKNNLLQLAEPENGDLIIIGDIDEFWHTDNFISVVKKFENDDSIEHIPVGWFNMVYNLKQGFIGSIDGRFFRYQKGCYFTNTNHFIGLDGKDKCKDYKHFIHYDQTKLVHLSYAKHPQLIKQKVVSFQRISFTNWWNHCYLVGASNLQQAYYNNERLSRPMGWPGTGWGEGLKSKIEPYNDELPEAIKDLNLDWIDYINKNFEGLKI